MPTSTLGNFLMDLYQKKDKEKLKMQAEGKEATNLRGLLGGYKPEMKDAFKTMGIDDLRFAAAEHAGQFQRQQEQEQESKAQLTLQQIAKYTRENEQGAAQQAQIQPFLKDFMALQTGQPTMEQLSKYYDSTSAEMPNKPQGAPSLSALQAYAQAGQNYPAMVNPEELMKYAAMSDRQPTPADYVPKTTEIDGKKFVYNPHSGNFAPLDKEKKPEKDVITGKKFDAKVKHLNALNTGIYHPMTTASDRAGMVKERAALQAEIDAFQAPSAAAASPVATQDAQGLIDQANAAIAKGANRDEVLKRLKAKGITIP